MAHADDRLAPGGVRVAVTPLADDGSAAVATMLDAAERTGGDVPPVDEAERRRLDALVDAGVRADGWHPLIARVDDVVAGYAAFAVTGGRGIGDAAVAHDVTARGSVLTALLGGLTTAATDLGMDALEVWIRRVADADLDAAATAGFDVERRLAILGTDLPTTTPAPAPPEGITIRGSRPEEDDGDIVEVLAAAYGTGPDGGWDLARFHERQRLDWFRPEDLLVAVDEDGRVLGLHWLKRRSATVGEVYNLAVHPDGQGRGLGPALLHAGLDHLTDAGCDEVLLWVDRANDRAVRLYTSQGMTTRWEDVALGRTLGGPRAAS
jgi:mycothiol synthase